MPGLTLLGGLVGTSRRWPGPSGGLWQTASANLTRSLNKLQKEVNEAAVSSAASGGPDEGVGGLDAPASVRTRSLSQEQSAEHAAAFRAALEAELCANPDSFGLRHAARDSGRQLIDLLDSLHYQGIKALGPLGGGTVEERSRLFCERFVTEVAGSARSPTDFVMRRAAVRSAEKLLDDSPALRQAVESGSGGGSGEISDELFCAIYHLFFSDVVTGFLEAVIAGKLQLMLPVLPMVDPTDSIVSRIAEQIASLIPTPCTEREDKGSHSSLVDLGRDLAEETIERALGIPGIGQP